MTHGHGKSIHIDRNEFGKPKFDIPSRLLNAIATRPSAYIPALSRQGYPLDPGVWRSSVARPARREGRAITLSETRRTTSNCDCGSSLGLHPRSFPTGLSA